MKFESRRGPKKEKNKKEKIVFCKLENLFFLLFFIIVFTKIQPRLNLG